MDPTVAHLFRQFFEPFKDFSYKPENPPEAEFQRLCSQRGWGPVKLQRQIQRFGEILQVAKLTSQQAPSTNPAHITNESASVHDQPADIAAFFKKYEFERFQFNPNANTRVEFQRLCQVRQWGAVKVTNALNEFQQTLKRQEASAKPAVIASTTFVRANAIEQFFKKYEFQDFKLNRKAPSNTEFHRLCVARKWGATKIADAQNEFQQALGKEQQLLAAKPGKVQQFFKKYEFHQFKWNSQASPNSEFDRLCVARKWGGTKIANARKEFQEASSTTQQDTQPVMTRTTNNPGASKTPAAAAPAPAKRILRPVAQFFTQFNCSRYRYTGRDPVRELELLTQKLHQPNWEKLPFHERLADCKGPEGEARRINYRSSNTAREFKRRFYEAVEEEFEEGITRRARILGLRPYEYVLELLGLGKAPVERHDAWKILSRANVNIYDFIDYETELLLIEEIAGAGTSNEAIKKPPKPSLYPSEEVLGVYCFVTGRIYPINLARASGTLRLLLKNVKRHFHKLVQVLETAQGLISSEKARQKQVQKYDDDKVAIFKVVTKIEEGLCLDPESRAEGLRSHIRGFICESDDDLSDDTDGSWAPGREWKYLFKYARTYYQQSQL